MSTQSISALRVTTIEAEATPLAPPRKVARRISRTIVINLLAVADSLAIFGSGFAALFRLSTPDSIQLSAIIPVLLLVTIVGVHLLRLLHGYRPEILVKPSTRFATILVGWAATFAASIILFLAMGPHGTTTWQWLSLWGGGALIALLAIQVILVVLVRRWRMTGRLAARVGVIGSGPIAQRLLYNFDIGTQSDVQVLGVFDDRAKKDQRCAGHPILGGVDDLVECVRRGSIDSVVIAMPLADYGKLLDCLAKLQSLSIDVRLCPDEIGVRLGPCRTSQLGGVTFLNAREKPFTGWRWLIKQAEDRILAAVILVGISPVMLAIAALIKLDSRGPVLFRQNRYGLNNELISVYKFRTMYDRDRDPNCERQTERNDPRVTRVGNILRRTSLDELPQLINVLLGNMSLVGPRPHAVSSKAGGVLFDDAVRFYHARHRVKPGITGWAQVSGWRGETTTIEQIKRRIEHDIFYIENWSLGFDLWIIVRTIIGGFVGRNAY